MTTNPREVPHSAQPLVSAQLLISSINFCFACSMRATLTKIGEGAFADVFGCQKEGWDRLAIKVSQQIPTCC